tara:strand:- start:292 stop:456 length:165 start_codon:yes stop_codon:yes gene_type:complete
MFHEFIRLLEKLKQNIFRDLDKAGDYRRVDEGEARRIVEKYIKALKDKLRSYDE